MKAIKMIFTVLMSTAFISCSAVIDTSKGNSIYDGSIVIKDIYGETIDLTKFKGKKVMFVNVASKCGFTPQYKGLEALYQKYKENLMIIGVPCNQFGGQEPGSSEEIASFCKRNYGVSFVITEKIDVKGENQHDLYKWLTLENKNGSSSSSVKWNFQKYLLDENGKLLDFWYSTTKPSSEKISKHL